MTKIKAYPVVISYDETESSKYKYLAYIPDLDGYTQGESFADAIYMSRDYLGTYSLEHELPEAGAVKFETVTGDTITFVDIDPGAYKKRLDGTPVKKTLSIPAYLNNAAIEEGLNFSQTLSDAIKEKLALH
jgi:predicted RNase H-like HicB family nuclease